VQGSLRYGLHFMFSDSCRYERNAFVGNAAGVAVMYAREVDIVDNVFRGHHGSAAYGLLLKEIRDSRIVGNTIEDNTTGMYLEGSNRNVVRGNRLIDNGWALRLLADAQENVVEGNSFRGNLFDLTTNARQATSVVRGNFWDRYRGYDLDRDGRGDVAHAPIRLFALVLERAPAALLLVRSPIADALDLAERINPLLTPTALRDPAPLMRPPPGHHP
jgi:nitrous oxidase accessory protein